MLRQLHRGLRADESAAPLTDREREVRSLMEQGLPDKAIAERLVLSVKTVEKHAGAVLRKTGARNRTELAALAAVRSRAVGGSGQVGEVPHGRWGFSPIRAGRGRRTVALRRPCVPVVPLKEIVDRAFAERYGVRRDQRRQRPHLEAVLAAAVEERSPLIVQTSVKTVRSIGLDLLFAMWREMTAGIEVPVSLHLDHCPDRAVITACLRKGWNSVLFDASSLPVAENQRQTVEVVAEARSYGAQVEGEIEAITGVEDGIGSDEVAADPVAAVALEFIGATGVDVFAPAIGNAHGVYRTEPEAGRAAGLRHRRGAAGSRSRCTAARA